MMGTMRARWARPAVKLVVAGLVLAGCGSDEVHLSRRAGGGGPSGSSGTDTAAPAVKKAIEAVTYRDEDFVESERNRDPFRSYMTTFQARAPEVVQRNVVMPTTAIESMRLIAVITGVPRPKAMLVDPMAMGHVVERGMYIGRPQVIQATGSVSMTLNWRVDRIRENEVVLTRQDPTDPTRPPLTRVIPLHEELAQNL